MSNVQMYADGILAYDNRLSDYAMQQILIEEEVNKGGTCTISMLPGHPAYDLFPAFRTPVEVYRDNKLRFRGRPLPLSDETYGIRTIICEGELCWLNDAVIRPYLYQSDPESIFTDIIAKYNAVVEPWKRFDVGTVTVTDSNNYIRLESTSAQSAYAVVMKLIDRCGGYIFFETLESGVRTINWYEEMPYTCSQEVAFGSNLISYTKEPNLDTFATRIIPYGAKDTDGNRLQINVDGKDYIQDDEAVSLRGVIEASVTWDDITIEDNLKDRAAQWLDVAKNIPYSIKLSAVDLSKQGYDMDSFMIGQRVPAASVPYELSGYYDLIALTEDLCDPRIGNATFGKESSSIIGSDVSSKRKTENSVDAAMQSIADLESLLNDEASLMIESTDYPGCYYRTVDGETEWLNPPMVADVEYRTTERIHGTKAVYTKLISVSGVGSAVVTMGDDVSSILRAAGRCGTRILPLLDSSGSPLVWTVIDGKTINFYAQSGYTNLGATMTVWYVKTS